MRLSWFLLPGSPQPLCPCWRCGLLAFLLGGTLLGCRSAEPELPPLYPVTGQVLHKGQPVQGGTVRFALLNEQAVLLIMGKVDQEGRFELTTRKGRQQGSGAPEGSYRVTYSPPQLGKNSLPVTSEQTYKVEARSNQFTFETGGGQPF